MNPKNIAAGNVSVTGAILCGGKNSRMRGKNKAFLLAGGIPLIERAVALFEELFDEILIVTNTPAAYKAYARRCRVITDEITGAGPLGGIHAALKKAKHPAVFVAGADMPFLNKQIIRRQLRRYRHRPAAALVPRIGRAIEPLHAIYEKRIAGELAGFLKSKNDRAVRSYLKTLPAGFWDLKPAPDIIRAFRNVNTPRDYTALKSNEDG